MKFILKLLLAPLMLVLWIVEWALTLALKASAVVCVIASALFLLLLCGRQRAERLHLSGHCVSAIPLRTALFGGEAHSAVYRHENTAQGANLRINGICGM